MANITLTIPDAVLPRVLDAYAAEFQYDRNKLPSETKAQFAKRMLGESIRKIVRNIEGASAAITARTTAETDADTNILIS